MRSYITKAAREQAKEERESYARGVARLKSDHASREAEREIITALVREDRDEAISRLLRDAPHYDRVDLAEAAAREGTTDREVLARRSDDEIVSDLLQCAVLRCYQAHDAGARAAIASHFFSRIVAAPTHERERAAWLEGFKARAAEIATARAEVTRTILTTDLGYREGMTADEAATEISAATTTKTKPLTARDRRAYARGGALFLTDLRAGVFRHDATSPHRSYLTIDGLRVFVDVDHNQRRCAHFWAGYVDSLNLHTASAAAFVAA